MEFHEYPKAVYKLDDQRIVQDAEEEEQASSEGYGPWVCYTLREVATPQGNEEQPSPLQPLDTPVGVASDMTKPEVMAALDAAGIEYDKRLGIEKLKAMLP